LHALVVVQLRLQVDVHLRIPNGDALQVLGLGDVMKGRALRVNLHQPPAQFVIPQQQQCDLPDNEMERFN
jgi:hypothetical protein